MAEQVSAPQVHSFFEGFSSPEHLKRFVLAMASLVGAIALAVIIVARFANLTLAGAGVQVRIAGSEIEGDQLQSISLMDTGIAIQTREGQSFANVLVPANQLWVRTDIKVQPGDAITLSASGSANLSEQLNLDATANPRSMAMAGFNFLVDPLGRRLNWRSGRLHKDRHRDADEYRNLIKLKPGYPLGVLIGTVAPDDNFIQDNPTGSESFAIVDLGPDQVFRYKGKGEGYLYLAVNDLVGRESPQARQAWMLELDPTGRPITNEQRNEALCEAFPLMDCDEANRAKRIQGMGERWDAMLASRKWETFYEDNSGYYLVTVAVRRE